MSVGEPTILRSALRMIWVPIALLLAIVVALFIILTLGWERIVQDLQVETIGREEGVADIMRIVEQLAFVGGVVSVLTIVPPVLLVIVGEVARIRSSIYYVVGGGIAAGVIPVLGRLVGGELTTLPSSTIMQVFATAGFAGGLVYWLLAGRSA